MEQTKGWSSGLVLVLAALFALPRAAQAGPPLICHALDIGGAKSLPWTSNTWNLSGNETYDLNRLVRDTLALLTPGTPVIVRMETIRRATLYGQQDQRIAKELLLKLRQRALDAEASGRSDALASFDLGYLIECYKQANWVFNKLNSGGWQKDIRPNPASGLDGYAWVVKAIRLRGGDAEMELAAALITLDSPTSNDHRDHVQKAEAGAAADTLLARNLAPALH